MDLTSPLIVADVQTTYPRDTRGMVASEIEELLRIEERALRTLYGVTSQTAATDAVLRDALLAAWPSFLQQIRQVAQETAGAASYSVTYNRAGVIDFTFPSFVAAMLSSVADAEDRPGAPSTTQLVR